MTYVFKNKASEKGSALLYILIAIALLAALTATMMDSSDQQASTQRSNDVTSELRSQIDFIRSAIQECVLTYPKGDTTMPLANPVGGQMPNRPYPLMASNTYMASHTAGIHNLKDIRCPGNPGNSNNHAKIFGGTSGKFLPPPPKLFNEWMYYNHLDGVLLFTWTDKTDAYFDSALKKLDTQYSKCEMQYINNTNGSADIVFETSGWACGVGLKCVVMRITTTGSATYPGETGCPS